MRAETGLSTNRHEPGGPLSNRLRAAIASSLEGLVETDGNSARRVARARKRGPGIRHRARVVLLAHRLDDVRHDALGRALGGADRDLIGHRNLAEIADAGD